MLKKDIWGQNVVQRFVWRCLRLIRFIPKSWVGGEIEMVVVHRATPVGPVIGTWDYTRSREEVERWRALAAASAVSGKRAG
jgi:hypothetical protein